MLSLPLGAGLGLTAQLLRRAVDATSVTQLRAASVEVLTQALPGVRIAWLSQSGSEWGLQGSPAALAGVPIDLAAAACDRGCVVQAADWVAAPLAGRNEPAEALLLSPSGLLDDPAITHLADVLANCLMLVHQHQRNALRVEHLQSLQDLAIQWHRSHDLTELLQNMARAAARVLQAERASIFLWDRPRRELVGHPALGVEGQALRIPDDQGIAGQVLKDGVTRRWDSGDDPQAINRQVGEQVGYVTRSLLAVLLVDRHGRGMGVFEVLNHREGRFSADDETLLSEMARHAAAALENTQQISDLVLSRERLVQSAAEHFPLVGRCPKVEALRQTIARIAPTDLAVLLLGENGTGKEVVSRCLHLQSDRKAQPFVAVNCAAIAESLLESELFGHEKGAFTDAISSRPGKFELAHGGTLLLDEIGEMSPSGQAKLLRVLEEKVVTRVGGTATIRTDVRVIAATNQNLVELVQHKRFREDLYFRLNVVTLTLPPLRDRGEDILVLAEHFLEDFSRKLGRPTLALSAAARQCLRAHAWPGNIRELRNLMERVAYLATGPTVEESDLAFVLAPRQTTDPRSIPGTLTLGDATSIFQTDYIQRHLEAAEGNMAVAAEKLGLHRSNLYRKMRQLGMDVTEPQ